MTLLAVGVELRCVFMLQGEVEKCSQAWMGLNYSCLWREKSCKTVHLHFSAPGRAAQWSARG